MSGFSDHLWDMYVQIGNSKLAGVFYAPEFSECSSPPNENQIVDLRHSAPPKDERRGGKVHDNAVDSRCQ